MAIPLWPLNFVRILVTTSMSVVCLLAITSLLIGHLERVSWGNLDGTSLQVPSCS